MKYKLFDLYPPKASWSLHMVYSTVDNDTEACQVLDLIISICFCQYLKLQLKQMLVT